jgi:addiction module RelE/StbE family toxin
MQVEYKKRFQKNFKKLPPKLKEKFYKMLEVFLKNKFDAALGNHSVDKAFPGCRSINITGDYRAVFWENDQVATFITIGTHSELYG